MLESLFRYLLEKNPIQKAKKDNYQHSNSQEIDRIFEAYHHNWWKHLLPEIFMLAPPDAIQEWKENSPARTTVFGVDCERFALGTTGIRTFLPIEYRHRIVKKPKEGDIVLHKITTKLRKDEDPYPHVGRYLESGYELSKWGTDGPILKHPVYSVPSWFGTEVIYFRISPREIKGMRPVSELIRDCVGSAN